MAETPPSDALKPPKYNIKDEIAHSEWKDDPIVGFDQRASLAIARWVLNIFGGVYGLSFIGLFILFFKTDTTFEKGSESIRFMIQSLLPLVTLAVGYYLGDRNRQLQSQPPSRSRK